MSGHNKWSTIKHKKGAADAKRGKLFSKIIKEITVAARIGGGDIDGNARLRSAVASAKAANMPKDNVDRAIKKGTGEMEGYNLEEMLYEGYGPEGMAILVSVLTDNKNRAVADVRHAFTKRNGNLGTSGSVAWMFQRKGFASIPKDGVDEDALYDLALNAGADDVTDQGDCFEVLIAPESIEDLRNALEGASIAYDELKISMIPENTIKLTGKPAEQAMKLLDHLDDLDDVQDVYTNVEFDDDELAQMQD